MKKLSILFASLLAVFAFSSCEEDTDPQYKAPTSFVLNTPPLANQLLELESGGTVNFSCSQPDYGYSAITQYSMEVALDEAFEKYESLESVDRTLAKMQIRQADLALAVCKLLGVESQDDFDPEAIHKLYFRAVAQLTGVESSLIKSNVVSLNQVKTYYAIQEPGFIYLVGAPEGWKGPDEANASHYESWKLYDLEGNKVYTGKFNIAADDATFRFYTVLSGWDGGASIGSQADDADVDFDFSNGAIEANLVVPGKGKYHLTNWNGGKVNITVDLGAKKVKIELAH